MKNRENIGESVIQLRPDNDPWERFIVSKEEAEEFEDSEFIVEGLIVQGHLHVIAAAPNAGKTTIFFHLAGEMAADGYEVIYVNVDISAADAKAMIQKADKAGVKLLLPDMKVGLSIKDVILTLNKINQSEENLTGQVYIFDTLKKMTDVINKRATKEHMGLLRGLTAKGATIICLAHTNKYSDQEGRPIYEGTGDIRSDVDNLIYLIHEKKKDGSLVVSVEPDKQRAALKPMTFEISPEREVIQTGYRDLVAEKEVQEQREKDQMIIEVIKEAISEGKNIQYEIVSVCTNQKISKSKARIVLKRYRDVVWKENKGSEKNTRVYELI